MQDEIAKVENNILQTSLLHNVETGKEHYVKTMQEYLKLLPNVNNSLQIKCNTIFFISSLESQEIFNDQIRTLIIIL